MAEPTVSTVLAQDHFYSDFLSLSLTILTHKGSMRMILICCGMESALASVTGGMNISTTDFLNGFIFVRTSCHERFVRQLLPTNSRDAVGAASDRCEVHFPANNKDVITRYLWHAKHWIRNTAYIVASLCNLGTRYVLNVFEST